MRPFALRTRLLLGAILWTFGLFAVTGVVITHLFGTYPRAPEIFHHPFTHPKVVTLFALACMVAGLVQVRSGLSSVNRLRTRLGAVRTGRDRRVEGSYPAEVQPLVDDLNALLEHRERTVKRAVTKAGDLAHGLKTPLALLAQEADRAHAACHHELAAAIAQHVDRMRRQMDYHLAQARAAASGATPGARCSVSTSADGLSRTLQRLYANRGLTIAAHIDTGHDVRAQREDVDEMLGNLLDNACKWASSRVSISSSRHDSAVLITVDDDGPGIPAAMHEAVLQRGVRADEAAPGSGLGLAIVRDLAEVYGGSIALSASPIGGLRATLRLPAC
jgi:signal transduction histidine kinase